VEYDSERSVNGSATQSDKAMGHLQGMNGEGSDFETRSGRDLAQVGVVEKLMFVAVYLRRRRA